MLSLPRAYVGGFLTLGIFVGLRCLFSSLIFPATLAVLCGLVFLSLFAFVDDEKEGEPTAQAGLDRGVAEQSSSEAVPAEQEASGVAATDTEEARDRSVPTPTPMPTPAAVQEVEEAVTGPAVAEDVPLPADCSAAPLPCPASGEASDVAAPATVAAAAAAASCEATPAPTLPQRSLSISEIKRQLKDFEAAIPPGVCEKSELLALLEEVQRKRGERPGTAAEASSSIAAPAAASPPAAPEETTSAPCPGSGEEAEPLSPLSRNRADSSSSFVFIESLGEDASETEEQEANLEASRAESSRLKDAGNAHFKSGELELAISSYTQSIESCPQGDTKQLSVLYGNRAACQQRSQNWQSVFKDASESLRHDPRYMKSYIRKVEAAEMLGDWSSVVADLKTMLELDPTQQDRFGPQLAQAERKMSAHAEKQKDEMMSSMKDMGNSFLGKFGMSTNDFKCEKDAKGGFNISFGGGK